MRGRVVREKTTVAFFHEHLLAAMNHQKVSASAFTEFYLVNLLAAFATAARLPGPEPGFEETPLAVALPESADEVVALVRACRGVAIAVNGGAPVIDGVFIDKTGYPTYMAQPLWEATPDDKLVMCNNKVDRDRIAYLDGTYHDPDPWAGATYAPWEPAIGHLGPGGTGSGAPGRPHAPASTAARQSAARQPWRP